MTNENANNLAKFLQASTRNNRENIPTNFGLLNALARPEATGLYFNGKTIHLDGYRFSGCRFDNCVLIMASTNFEMTNCVIDKTTSIRYAGGLSKVLQLFLSKYEWAPLHFPQPFIATQHSSGGISLEDRGE
ncbi:hypothetical protein [Variovorax sp. 770b2]|uniref:hypothetical protein n=1 Tax=Variovorax sp. 770b2 TaxID=1566271 RepID=UPI001160D9D6|nr:hypothetical protein [Variovorax sp. 770b2]